MTAFLGSRTSLQVLEPLVVDGAHTDLTWDAVSPTVSCGMVTGSVAGTYVKAANALRAFEHRRDLEWRAASRLLRPSHRRKSDVSTPTPPVSATVVLARLGAVFA